MGLFSKKKLENSNVRSGRFKELGDLVTSVNKIFDSRESYSDNLFISIGVSIYKLIGAKIIVVGKADSENREINTYAYLIDGKVESNFTYSLSDTPCEKVLGNYPCSYPINVANLFPLDKVIVENNIESYVGIPLFYKKNKPMGILAVMFDFEIPNDYMVVESILRIYGIRIGSEMEHLDYHQLLEEQNNELNLLFEELKDKNRKLDAYVVEVENARKEAEESNQLKSAFLANLSHEVRTPMNVILGFSELLKSEHLTLDDRKEYIDIINQNGTQLLKIMDNLIDISKFQSKALVTNPKPLRLNKLLDYFFQNFLEYIRVSQKPLRLYLEKGLPDSSDNILIDQEGLSKILDQLLDNSVKFTSEGWIKFGYDVADNSIQFYVKDTGVGIPEGMEVKIFDMFRQVDLRASRDFGGNGLGLAIAKKYTEIIGGKIWIEQVEDCSTCFYLKLPFDKAEK